jgi:quinone-modifying oxidoreductase subunit QmoB
VATDTAAGPKLGTYICTGCGLGEALDIAKLEQIATKDHKAPICKTHPFFCSEEGVKVIKDDIAGEGVNRVVIAACSGRVNQDVFAFGKEVILDRVNLREQVAWSHPPKDADTDQMAQDYLRMGLVKNLKTSIPQPPVEQEVYDALLVIGAGAAGMQAAIDAAKAGAKVYLVEKEAEIGGYMRRLYRQLPQRQPYTELIEPEVLRKQVEVKAQPNIEVLTSTEVVKISGQPGLFSALVKNGGTESVLKVGAVVLATGSTPYDPHKLGHLGYGAHKNVVSSDVFEEMAKARKIVRPSDGRLVESVAFILCAGSRDKDHLPYCSTTCCATSLKQAAYVREANPDARAFVFYRDIRTPGHYEYFYKAMQQDEGVFLTKGDVTSVTPAGDHRVEVSVADTLLGGPIAVQVDLVVLATGMVPSTLDHDILGLQYRQGPALPDLKYGFPDSHFICFPYETRRTGIFAAGTVRSPMDVANCYMDGAGAAMKAIQAISLARVGQAALPRAMDPTFPEFGMQRCTACKRCTEECPFGTLNEDEKGYPQLNINRCRRCGICMGACPERIISFQNYSIDGMSSQIRAIEIPEEDEGKWRVLAFMCENDAYPALDMAGVKRLQHSASIRVVPVRCLGAINQVWIADSLSRGFDGVMLLGCKYGDNYQCHMIRGSELAVERLGKIQETLDRLQLEAERIQYVEFPIDDYTRFPQVVDDFMANLEKIGPNPFKGF